MGGLDRPLARLPYHVGLASASLEAGQEAMTKAFGFSWEPPYHSEALRLMSPTGPVSVDGITSHSLGGPMRVEICVGTLWRTDADVELHHYAYWSADVARDAAELEAQGWQIEVCALDADDRPAEFAYVIKPGQPRLELVDVARQPAYCQRVDFDVPIDL